MTVLVPVKYDRIIPFYYTNFTIAIVNGKAGMIDLEGNPLTEFVYDNLSDEYINLKENTWYLYSDCCSLSLDGKWGIIDGKGNVVIDFKYDKPIMLTYHHEDVKVFIVELNGKYAVYNNEWKQLTKFYDKIYTVSGGFVYMENGKFGIIDYYGNIKLQADYDNILHQLHAYKDILVCKKNGYYGIIQTNGEIIIDCIFDKLSWFSKNGKYIIAKKKGCDCWGVIDIYNKTVILDYEFNKIEFCSSGNKEGYVTTNS